MKKSLSLFLLVIISGCSSHTYHAEALALTAIAQEVLIKEGICATKDQCQREERVLYRSGGWDIGFVSGGGVSLNVYGISSTKVAESLAAEVAKAKSAMPSTPIYLSVFSNRHLADKSLLKSYSFK